ncbi:GAP family protein [Actinopolymorpha sp. NPDC004070]|uniref:GAP family protein n=1 Tax=Actinopolymorpha sp. NPDC004070 TaxID=3154548 RepID=UPI0033A0CED9
MRDLLTVLPLAVVMVAGPQIISAVFLATNPRWVSCSLAYVAGAALSILAVCTIAYLAASFVRDLVSVSAPGSSRRWFYVAIFLLLLYAMVYVFLHRGRPDPPAWMGKLQEANVKFAFGLGFLLLGFFPSDLATSLTVGLKLATDTRPWWHMLPFIGLTLLLLALPALCVLALGERGRHLLPRVRDWMNNNSWIISEAVIVLFIVLTVQNL